jgi:hypothetical protein
MASEPLHVGTLVIHPKKSEWGPGKVIKLDGQRAHVVWRDLSDREAKVMVTSVLELAHDQSDPILDNLPPLAEKDGRMLLPKNRVIFDQAVASFLARFPQGFYDPAFLGDGKTTGERLYKWAAHEFYEERLGNGKFGRLLKNNFPELVQEIERCVGRVNLLSRFEASAFRDALKVESAAKVFAHRLFHLLESEHISADVFVPYVESVCSLPAERSRVATWTVATIIPYLAQPDRHMFLKPETTKNAADALGFELNYRSEPNWLTYSSLLRMADVYRQKLSHLKPRDLIDVQSFFYVACGGYK